MFKKTLCAIVMVSTAVLSYPVFSQDMVGSKQKDSKIVVAAMPIFNSSAQMSLRNDIIKVAECGNGQKQCRVGVSTWCCSSKQQCVYDEGGCK